MSTGQCRKWPRQAIREYVENHSRAELIHRVLDDELPRYAEALERLGQ